METNEQKLTKGKRKLLLIYKNTKAFWNKYKTYTKEKKNTHNWNIAVYKVNISGHFFIIYMWKRERNSVKKLRDFESRATNAITQHNFENETCVVVMRCNFRSSIDRASGNWRFQWFTPNRLISQILGRNEFVYKQLYTNYFDLISFYSLSFDFLNIFSYLICV